MEQEERATSANRSERTVVNDPEKTAVVPRFDEKSIRRARPAVPLGGLAERARRLNPLVVLVIFAGLLGVAAGVVGTYVYQSRRAAEQTSAAPSHAPAEAATAGATAGDAARGASSETASPAAEEELFKPDAGDLPEVAPPRPQESPHASGEAGAPVEIRPAGVAEEVDPVREQATLRAALDEWIGATNARDIGRQMEFYDARLDAYYLSRGTPAQAVRAEKERVFGRASSIDVRASGAAIRFSPDGRTATMRFRKSYEIGGGGEDRRGEVVQELRWRKTDAGWKIVSERDVRVLK